MKILADLLGKITLSFGTLGVTYTSWFVFDEAECPEEINN
ncbi:MAG: cyclic lactone autoinducer peptide [Bacilli bacterium]